MKAILVIPGETGPTLSLQDIDAPAPAPHEILVSVKAAGLNRTDLRRVQQHYKSGGAHIAGLEMAGVVVGVGSEVVGFELGDRVMSQGNGCYAEMVSVDHRIAMKVPDGLSWEAAAAIPVAMVTAHDALATNGHLSAGQSLLIQAVTSGVGIAAIQIARILRAGPIAGTTRNPTKATPLQELGLDLSIDVSSYPEFAPLILGCTKERGVDLVADMVGGGALRQNMLATAVGGRIVSIGRMGGLTDTIDLDLLALRRISLIGVTFRTRTIAEKQAANHRFLADLGTHLASGRLRPIVARTFPLDAALEAQEQMRCDKHLGKIVLMV